MSTPLTTDELSSYTILIDDILATADLETISRKKIRQDLEADLGGKDLSGQRSAIKRLIEGRFDAIYANGGVILANPNPTSNKHSTSHATSLEPDIKKTKRPSSVEDADARLAAQLQAQENRLACRRKTRAGGKLKAPKRRAAPRRRRSGKAEAASDSDINSGSVGKKRNIESGFHKRFNLSLALSELCDEDQLSRPEVVKRLWKHIKTNNLQDPKDKRQIICDEKMRAIFKQSKVNMFRMNKKIGNHLIPS